MAAYSTALDLYFLLVENIFGSVILAGLGLIMFFIVIGMIAKWSPTFMIFFVGLFIMTFTIGYVGSLGAVLFGIIALYYFYTGLVNLIGMMRG